MLVDKLKRLDKEIGKKTALEFDAVLCGIAIEGSPEESAQAMHLRQPIIDYLFSIGVTVEEIQENDTYFRDDIKGT